MSTNSNNTSSNCGATANPGKYTLPGLYKQCPNVDNGGKFITFRLDELALISGSNTELAIPLRGVSTQVEEATQTTLTIPAKDCTVRPINYTKLDLGGIADNGKVKFIAIFPQYPQDEPETNRFLEWTFVNSLDEGQLFDMEPVGPSFSSYVSLNALQINQMEFGIGASYDFHVGGTGPLWIASEGGLSKWDGTDMKVWNTFNSALSTDFIKTVMPDTHGWIWVGTDRGFCKFTESNGFKDGRDTTNSDLISDNIRDIALLSVDRIAIATDAGLSIYNHVNDTFTNFTIYNTPQLGSNDIRRVHVTSDYRVYVATPSGVYEYISSSNTWNATPFNSTIAGWTAPDGAFDISVYGGNIWVGTTGGLVVAPQSGATATTIFSGTAGPLADDYTVIQLNDKSGHEARMYFGHSNGYSVYGLTSSVWGPTGGTAEYANFVDGVNDIVVDRSRDAITGETIFFGNAMGMFDYFNTSGITGSPTASFGNVPETSKVSNLMMTYPGSTATLYASNQEFYFEFSKPMTMSSFESVVTVNEGVTGAGATVTGTWSWSNFDRTATFIPATALDKATAYRLQVANGSTATDGSFLKENVNVTFYTESIVPILGWNPIGNVMMLSGNSLNLVQSIYLRNLQNFDIEVTAMIGR